MITIEERNLFEKWEAVKGKTFDTVKAARAWCVDMSDTLGIAYRILQDGQPIDVVDLEADFFAPPGPPPRRADQSLDDPALATFFDDLAELDADRARAEGGGANEGMA